MVEGPPLRRSRIALARLGVLALFLLAMPLHAQTLAVRWTTQAPNCALADRASDNPFDYAHHYVQRRYMWHAEYAMASSALSVGIHRTTGLSPIRSALVSTFAVGVLPHLVGYGKGQYNVSLDWLFDAWTRGLPATVVLGERIPGDRELAAISTALVYAGGYAALACFASP